MAGPSGIGITLDSPETAFIIGSIALAAILFESGYNTPVQSYRLALWPALTLATIGVVLTAGGVMIASVYLLHLSWLEAAFLGAILSSTDAAAIFFLLRAGGINIRDRVRSTLEIESGTNDPMAIMLTMALVQIASMLDISNTQAITPLTVLWRFCSELSIGLLVGYVGGRALVYVINKMNFQAELYPLISLIIAFFVFALAGKLHGSGFLAIYVAGLVAGNSRIRNSFHVRKFHEGISWLSQLIMFIVLGLMADASKFIDLAAPSFILAMFLMLFARPFASYICLFPFRFTPAEYGFVAWAGLRGAVSILLALLPVMSHLPGSDVIFSVSFLVVIYSLLIQGWTIAPMAKALNLIVPAQTGPLDRIEFTLTPNRMAELVAYRVHPESPLALGGGLPAWSSPALILRDNKKYFTVDAAKGLKPNDRVYFFTDPDRLAVFDRLFGAPMNDTELEREFFGDISLHADITLQDLAREYDIQASDAPDMTITLAQLFKKEFKRGYEIGDRIRVGRIELIIRELDEGAIKTVGLAFTAPPLRDQIMRPVEPVQQFIKWVRHHIRASR